MLKVSAVILAVCILGFTSFGQSKADREKTKILAVFNEYVKAMQFEQPERDKARERLLTGEYFYMGMDGLPAGERGDIILLAVHHVDADSG